MFDFDWPNGFREENLMNIMVIRGASKKFVDFVSKIKSTAAIYYINYRMFAVNLIPTNGESFRQIT